MVSTDIKHQLTCSALIAVLSLAGFSIVDGYYHPLRLVKGYEDVKIPKWIPSEASNIKARALWLKADGTEGWAVGDGGVVLYYHNDRWRQDTNASRITTETLYTFTETLYALWMKADGTEGWAVGRGVILHYHNGYWEQDIEASNITIYPLYALWLKADGTEGWAIGYNGLILGYRNGRWKLYSQVNAITKNSLYALWLKADGTEGWAMGEKVILHYFSSDIGEITFTSEKLDTLEKLKGEHTLHLDKSIIDRPIIELLDKWGANRLPDKMYEVKATNNKHMDFSLKFTKVPSDFLKDLKEKKFRILINLTMSH